MFMFLFAMFYQVFPTILAFLSCVHGRSDGYDNDQYHFHHQRMSSNNVPKVGPDWVQIAQEELTNTLQQAPNMGVARNVIMFLGDGMGFTTVTAARMLKANRAMTPFYQTKLGWDSMPYGGFSKTYDADQQVPDSAGTATAFLCGEKARDGVICVNQDTIYNNCTSSIGNHLTSILHHSMMEGKRTGVISTARITHATPASSYAHSPNRDWESNSDVPLGSRGQCLDIAYQLVHSSNNSNINVILGGGRSNFLPDTVMDPEYNNISGARTDGINLVQDWIDMKASEQHRYVWNKPDFDMVDPNTVDYLLGLFEPNHMQFETNRDPAQEPSLTELVEKAINILSRGPNGYFLLVESGRIDHSNHDTNAHRSLTETIEMSNAVEKAIKMNAADNTLIVVTADHSHALTINGYQTLESDILGLADLSMGDDDKPYLTLSYANGPGFLFHRGTPGNEQPRRDLTGEDTTGVNYKQDAGVPLTSETHAGEDVPVYAWGAMSQLFTGTHEQHYIAHAMMYASCVGSNTDHCSTPGK